MRNLDITFIGTGNAFSPAGLCCNGFLVNRQFLFDAPPQSLSSLNTIGIDANEIDAVVISHHHGDHFLGLPFLLLHWRWKGRTKPVRIIGPRGTEALGKDIAEKVFPGVLSGTSYDLEWLDAAPGSPVLLKGLEVEPHLMTHDEGLEMCLGYGIRVGRHRLGYTGDTILCDSVMDLARSSDILISECASRDGKVPVHMNLLDDMPIVRAAMKPEAELILTHISPDVDTNGMKLTRVAKDFETYTF
ncbi:MAG: MBL fold metallo-hydrolase [Dehalococcoidia bacterium]